MIKKILLGIVNTISVIIIVFAVLVLLTVVMTRSGDAPSFMGYSVFEVVTGSMEPTIGVDDMVVVKQADPAEIKEGDIISFYSTDPALSGAVNTHRVVEVDYEDDHYYFTTKGDANNVVDQYVTQDVDLIGKVVFHSAILGLIIHLLSNPLIFIPLIAVPLLLMVLLNLRDTVRLARKIEKEEQEEALKQAMERIRKERAEQQKDPEEKP